MPVSLPAGVLLRGSTFHLRIGVPDDIKHLWPRSPNGKQATDAYRKSLRTQDRNDAAAKAHALIAQYQSKFEALRAGARPAALTPVTDELLRYISQKVERDILALDDLLRSNPRLLSQMIHSTAPRGRLAGQPVVNEAWDAVGQYLYPEQYENVSDIHRAIVRHLRSDLMIGRLDAAKQIAEAACSAISIRVDWAEPQARMGLQKIIGAMVRAWHGVEKRDSGEPIETPESPSAPHVATPKEPTEVTAPPLTLRDIVPSWRRRTQADIGTVSRAEKAIKLFEMACGQVPLNGLKRAHGAQFIAYLLDDARPFRPKTAANHASYITALLNVAVRDDVIDRNPLDLSIDKSAGAETREPWTDDELNCIFSHPLFSERMADVPEWQHVSPSDGRALLLILMHTGARIGEIAQLRRGDFQLSGSVMTVRITPEAGRLKTRESARTIPLAQHLLSDVWFSNWLADVTDGTEPDAPAFPSMSGRARGPSDTAVQWFHSFRGNAGLPAGKLKGSHRFRHWIRSALAAHNIGEETADAITGHAAQGSSGRVAYTKITTAVMLTALNSLPFPKIAA